MKRNLQKILVLTMLSIATFIFTACGSSSKGDDSGADKSYVIATDTTFAPFEYTDENNKFVGIDVDILAAIAEDQGFKYELQPLGFDASLTAVQAGEVDAMIAGMSITDKRKETYDFSEAYYDSGVVVAVAADSDYTSYEDLKGKTVAVKNGTEGATFAESIEKEYELKLSYYDDSAYMYQAVLNGDAAACVEDYPVIGYGIAQGNGLKMIGEMVKGSSYGFAVLKGQNGELIDMFNAGLENIIKNGTYDEIINKYIAEE
ncbi:transporter substrate-binding domain-containing protein [Alloiococcus sp. CFN-8]|uniref:transporter substrate-binding domain-containing protein n=1 Tax=Alloiococcus sp. CFN-8 TaxID=3416081 RepID=UPI003CF47BF0